MEVAEQFTLLTYAVAGPANAYGGGQRLAASLLLDDAGPKVCLAMRAGTLKACSDAASPGASIKRDGKPCSVVFQEFHLSIAEASGPWQSSGAWWDGCAWQFEEWNAVTHEPVHKLRLRYERGQKTGFW